MKQFLCFIFSLYLTLVNCKISEEPLFLRRKNERNYELANPIEYNKAEKGFIISKGSKDRDDNLYYACPYTTLKMKVTNSMIRNDRILQKKKCKVTESIYDDNIYCEKRVESLTWETTINKNQQKADLSDGFYNMKTYSIGFQVNSEGYNVKIYNFPLIDIFFDDTSKQTIAARHKLQYIIPSEASDEIELKYKIFEHDLGTQNYLDFFTHNKQIELIRPLGSRYTIEFINKNEWLIQQPLVPINDFLLPIWKQVVFKDSNTAPMWSGLSTKWKEVETLCQTLAENYGSLTITTGISKVLKLSTTQGKEVVMKSEKIKAPDLWWKAIEIDFEDNVYGMIIIMRNNPFQKFDPLNQNICNKYGWQIPTEYHENGLIFCYEMNENNIILLEAEYILTARQIFNLNSLKPKN